MKAKLPVIILWLGTAAAMGIGYAYGYFAPGQPVPFFIFPLIGPVAFMVTQFLSRPPAKM
jgi:hypothetical protein